MKKLPIGRQHFAGIIQEGLLYVDKTQEISNMIAEGNLYFLSRPRRFGKSLLIATLEEIFKGNQALFKGLYIKEKTDYAWDAYPVLTFNFANFGHKVETLEIALQGQLQRYAKHYHINLLKPSLSEQVEELLTKISEQHGPIVLLIDEYDKPIIDFITDKKKANKNRTVLRDFFSSLKGVEREGHLRFLFITGVSKFSKVSLFSDLNNLTDLTVHALGSQIVGITQQELLAYFEAHIEATAKTIQVPANKLLEGIKLWYNGYSWDGITTLYNPFSLLSFFLAKSFHNFWFATGTPTFLVETLRNQQVPVHELEQIEVSTSFFDKFSIENLDMNSLLFQTGYLTIQSTRQRGWQNLYKLGYPNEEVRQAFTHNLLEAFTYKVASTVSSSLIKIETALETGNLSLFIEQLKILFADISYHLHPKSKKQPTKKEQAQAFTAWEGYFQTIIYLICTFLNLQVQTEITKHQGRLDLLVETDDFLYLMEFKLDAPADDAIEQIKSRKYITSYKNTPKKILLVGIGFSKEERNVENWEMEEWRR